MPITLPKEQAGGQERLTRGHCPLRDRLCRLRGTTTGVRGAAVFRVLKLVLDLGHFLRIAGIHALQNWSQETAVAINRWPVGIGNGRLYKLLRFSSDQLDPPDEHPHGPRRRGCDLKRKNSSDL